MWTQKRRDTKRVVRYEREFGVKAWRGKSFVVYSCPSKDVVFSWEWWFKKTMAYPIVQGIASRRVSWSEFGKHSDSRDYHRKNVIFGLTRTTNIQPSCHFMLFHKSNAVSYLFYRKTRVLSRLKRQWILVNEDSLKSLFTRTKTSHFEVVGLSLAVFCESVTTDLVIAFTFLIQHHVLLSVVCLYSKADLTRPTRTCTTTNRTKCYETESQVHCSKSLISGEDVITKLR